LEQRGFENRPYTRVLQNDQHLSRSDPIRKTDWPISDYDSLTKGNSMNSTQQMLQTEVKQQADQPIDPEALAAIRQTQRAIDSIRVGKNNDALNAIETASGKVNILLARNPATALIPVNYQVAVFDTAPDDIDSIRDIGVAADDAVELGDYPGARALLYGLMSEIRIHVHNLPLASYPAALSTAARLLEQNRAQDAADILDTALSTLVLTDRVIPIPMLLSREAIAEAQTQREQDQQRSSRIVEAARQQLQRARELGYAIGDADYQRLNDEISDLQKQLKGNENADSLFSKIRERLASFLNRQSQHEQVRAQARSGDAAQEDKKAA
jgi:hypothetical protein